MVAGEGPQPSLGMIVGEAPGRKEIELGRPFVGPAGGLLESALRAVGVAREEVFITNVVKELPLDSDLRIRRPYTDEIEAWMPILEGEIEHTAPAAILALGTTAAKALTGLEGNIPWGSVVGNVHVAWHPSYLLHGAGEIGPQEARTIWLEHLEDWAEAIHAAA